VSNQNARSAWLGMVDGPGQAFLWDAQRELTPLLTHRRRANQAPGAELTTHTVELWLDLLEEEQSEKTG